MLCISLWIPGLVSASWKSEACRLDNPNCSVASSDFTVPYCLKNDVDYASTCIWPALTNSLSSIQDKDKTKSLWVFDMKDIIYQYCISVLWDSAHWRIYYAKPSPISDSWDWQQTFDSHQSLFAYALCSSFKDKEWNRIFLPEDLGKSLDEYNLSLAFKDWEIVDILRLQQKSNWKDLCSLSDFDTLSDCDMSIYATEIFTAIMSDFFKIKHAQVLQVNTVEGYSEKRKEMVEDFFRWYYDIKSEYEVLKKTFPQSVEVLESNMDTHKKTLDALKIINNSELATMAENTGCPEDGNFVGLDFIACALHSTQWKWMAIEPTFITMFHNEIMHYRVFINYQNLWINDRVADMNRKKEWEKGIKVYESKSPDFQLYWNIQLDAAKFALYRLEDFSMSYPLHIGIWLYIEKEKQYRDRYLSPIVTLFYSLSEKLKNVQIPS